MNTNTKRLFLCSLLALFSLGVWAQQSASSGSVDSLSQITTSPSTSQPSTKTADGVSVCRAEDKSTPLPGVTPPKPTFVPEVTLPEEARGFFRNSLAIERDQHVAVFVTLVGLTVDIEGMPRDICVVKEAGHGLDKRAFDSVAKYRFDPATFDGKPVPTRVVVEIGFKPL